MVLRANSENALNTGVFAIDFSPFCQSTEMLLSLFAGKSIPAEIRVRWIPNGSQFYQDLKTLKKTWCCLGPVLNSELLDVEFDNDAVLESMPASNVASSTSLHANDIVMIADELPDDYALLIKLIERIKRKWDCNMNLYNHNCQHFSEFVLHMVRHDEVCRVDTDTILLPIRPRN